MFWLKIVIFIIVIFLFRRPILAFFKAVFVSAYNCIVGMLGNAIARIFLIGIGILLIFIITKHYERLP